MTFSPYRLRKLAEFWELMGGVNLGIVGNARHTTGYHLGADRLQPGDYSTRLPRDSQPTNAASAIDLGKLDGSLANLRLFSRWLVRECMADAPGTDDIREIIYTPDGQIVRRWDNVEKHHHLGGDGTGQGDDSHKQHTHISWFRDSQGRDKKDAWRPYFQTPEPVPPPGPTCEDELTVVRAQLAVTQAELAGALDRLTRISDIAEGDEP